MNKNMTGSNKRDLKQSVNEYYEAVQLSEKQLLGLESLMGGEHLVETEANRSVMSFWGMYAFAASLLITISLIAYYPSPQADIRLAIAEEVVKNHIKMKPLEVSSNNFTVVRNYFTQLDFVPSSSSHSGFADLAMLGARYCSIQSVTAAQLRYKGVDGTRVTLYEVGYDVGVFGEMPVLEEDAKAEQLLVNGLKVSMWVEKGLLMVTVSD